VYTKTYICDFTCATLADAACVLCRRHGCEDHLPHAVRVAFEIGPAYVVMPALPLDGHDPIDDVSPPVVSFDTWAKLKLENRVKHIDAAVVERETAERRVCDDCWKVIHGSHYRHGGGEAVIRAALEAFVRALRAGLTAAGLNNGDQK
jgi:hypothetical protein